MTHIYLVRHGETAWNVEGRFQGQSDTPINETGRQQADALGRYLKGKNLQAIYTSDLIRALDTSRIIAAYHNVDIKPDPRLRELNFGSWEGMDYYEIQSKHPIVLTEWQENILKTAPPGGESLEQLAMRVQVVYEHIISTELKGEILIVAHGGVLQVLLCYALNLPFQNYWQFHLDPGSLSEIAIYPEGVILNRLNVTFGK